MNLSDFKTTAPSLNLEEFFSGKTIASGLFEDRFGKVRTQFKADINGHWDGRTLTLEEDFLYVNGDKEQRVWAIEKVAENIYHGSTDSVVGLARGKTAGNAFNWRYDFNLEVSEGKVWRVRFDDWMFLQPNGVLLNKARVTRWGVTIGTVFISFSRDASEASGTVDLQDPANEAGNRDSLEAAQYRSAE